MAVARPDGVWVATDHRITNIKTKEILDHHRPKGFFLSCQDGWLTLGFTGIARFGGERVTDWLTEVFKGGAGTVESALAYLAKRATADLSTFLINNGYAQVFLGGGIRGGKPFLASVANVSGQADWTKEKPKPEFSVAFEETEMGRASVAGQIRALSPEDVTHLMTLAQGPPREWKDISEGLAEIVRRSSKNEEYGYAISPSSTTVFVSAMENAAQQIDHWDEANPPSDDVRPVATVMGGMDFGQLETAIAKFHTDLQSADETVRKAAEAGFATALKDAGLTMGNDD